MTLKAENLTPIAHAAQNRCFGCGQANAGGLHLEFLKSDDGLVVCHATIPESFEGPVGFVHGGIIATLLDEVMSKAVRAQGVTAMTRQLEVEYLRPVPSGRAVRMEGRVVRNEGRKHWSEARIENGEGIVLATGKGLFVEVRASRMKAGREEGRPAEKV